MQSRQKSTLLCFFADLCLTIFAVVGVLFCVITAFDIKVNNLILILVCVLASLAWTLLFSIPRFLIRLGVGVAAFGAFAVIGIIERKELITGAKTFLSWILGRYARFIDGITPFYPLSQLRLGINESETMLFVIMLAVLLAFAFSLVLSRTKSVLPVFIISVPFFASCMFIVNTTPDMIPFVMITTFWAILLFVDFLRKANKTQSAKVILIMTPVVAALLTLVILFYPSKSYTRYGFINSLHKDLLKILEFDPTVKYPGDDDISKTPSKGENGTSEGSQDEGSGYIPGSSEGSEVSENSGDPRIGADAHLNPISLSNLHNIKFNDKTLIKVRTTFNKNFLLRGFSSGNYTGQNWLPTDEGFAEAAYRLMERYSLPKYMSALEFPAMAIKNSNMPYDAFWASINCYDLTNPLVFTPPNLLGDDDFIRYDGYYLFPKEKISQSYGYIIDYYVYAGKYADLTLPDNLADYEKEYRELVYKYFLDVPYMVTGTLDEKIAIIGIDETMTFDEKVKAVEKFIESYAEYTLDISPLPKGVDFVTNFLDNTRQGFCMHFASAATLIYRRMGIPARYVSGFYADRNKMDRNSYIIITDRQAHAWVEVYCDGVGWIPVNVTPGFVTYADNPENPDISQPDISKPEFSHGESSEEEFSDNTTNPESSEEEPIIVIPIDNNNSTPFYIILGVVLALAAVVGRRYVMMAVRDRRFAENSNNKSVINIWKYITVLTRGCIPDKDIYAIAQKARFSQHVVNDAEKQKMKEFALSLAKSIYLKKNILGKIAMKYIYAIY